MTFASIPVLRNEPALYARLAAPLLSREHDPRDIALEAGKRSMMIGMGMTEKQGGSDVRSNRTRAFSLGAAGAARRIGWSGTNGFSPRRSATRISCSRAPPTKARCRASTCRASHRMAARTRFRFSV